MAAGARTLSTGDIDLIKQLLIDQTVLRHQLSQVGSVRIAEKFEVCPQVIYQIRQAHIREIGEEARRCLSHRQTFTSE